ncbi:uncharacterized protein J8A68_003365 [[Candida] subhashii]|uniref:Uncharacterized protein n=1 Tax=[Candida] subhashii TaxID=561895 RepID=A0A8J5UHM5_9ASCO|nr:uncharacterized protein J8A68_003365 [[Candida] subhashii]KAG7663093.1 hypothetical protein J8A68_003365 [[Candida] subhashii]
MLSNQQGNENLNNEDDDDQVSFRKFATHEELANSKFWKNLQRAKDTQLAQSTAAIIEDKNTTYIFAESEFQDSDDDSDNDNEAKTQGLRKSRAIKLIEISFGPRKSFNRTVPLTGCITMRNASPSIGQLKMRSLKLSIPQDIYVKGTLFALTASFGAGATGLSLYRSKSTGIVCRAETGGRVQIFKTETFAFFPEARMRHVVYRKVKKKVMSRNRTRVFRRGRWKKMQTSLRYNNLGVIFLDLSSGERPYCESRNEELRCGSNMSPRQIFEDIELPGDDKKKVELPQEGEDENNDVPSPEENEEYDDIEPPEEKEGDNEIPRGEEDDGDGVPIEMEDDNIDIPEEPEEYKEDDSPKHEVFKEGKKGYKLIWQ